MNVLAADIGGTYSRFAWSTGNGMPMAPPQTLRNAEFGSLEAAIEHALAGFGQTGGEIDHMVLAVPGPVDTDPVVLTNINWQLERTALRQRFQAGRLTVINDFQAAAIGAIADPIDKLKVLNPAAADTGPKVVAGAGTGLGMAWFCRDKFDTLPQATEGGHIDFAPGSESELGLYRHLAARYGHVSYERILSGQGLVESYRFLAADAAMIGQPAEVADLARNGEPTAIETMRLFVAVFAAYAGNLALAFNPTGGIYLCGGLTVHLASWFKPTEFIARYTDKGRMADNVRRIPVFLVTRHDTGLAGALDIAHKYDRTET